jgi:hypothetical protein
MSMCLDVTNFIKDNMNGRKNLVALCDRLSLEAKLNARGKLNRPKAPYCVKLTKSKEVFRWLKTLTFLDCYAVNIKRVINVRTGKLNGLKRHDYHIFIERLVPVMFCGYFKADLWKMFAELSYFYRHICAKQVSKAMIQRLEKEIVVLVCKMETVFPPGLFNAMQHLQFRWMHSQEKELKKLRYMVHNKARVEGCIVEAFACKEITNFSSMYFSCANNVNAVGRISRSYCTSHVVATTFDRISAAFGSRLLASPPHLYPGQPGGTAPSQTGQGYWPSPTPWGSRPGGQASSPSGSPPLRTPPLRPTTSTPPTVRQAYVEICFVCLLDYFAFLTRSFTCLLGWLRIITRQQAGIRLRRCPLQHDGMIQQQCRGAVVSILLSLAIVLGFLSLVVNYIVLSCRTLLVVNYIYCLATV